MFANTWNTAAFYHQHSGEILIFVLFAMLMATLVVLVPQLIKSHLRRAEMQHEEHMKAIENGMMLPPVDEASKAAGRTAMLVPMVVLICAGTVTCFLVAYRNENVFSVSLAVWTVGGVVSLAAITGSVALIGRLAQLQSGDEDEVPRNPLDG